MEKDVFFVNLESPGELRRLLLESSSLVLDAFKSYEKYKQTTQEKLQYMQQLRTLVDEIKALNKSLLSYLPKVHLQYKGDMKPTEIIPGVDRHQLQKLEADIKAIEDELASLD